ncbi:hypothetical protein Pint_07371 [Pistacia integerrima]|uniref:Uncharacterized protein n=1 Tax=Pistacia integerrima TaxID=434235 RepID=A0ACC0XYQ7_9ROSI|nr:hypothetical protein Pint_07371 [Pistacia integerrima]
MYAVTVTLLPGFTLYIMLHAKDVDSFSHEYAELSSNKNLFDFPQWMEGLPWFPGQICPNIVVRFIDYFKIASVETFLDYDNSSQGVVFTTDRPYQPGEQVCCVISLFPSPFPQSKVSLKLPRHNYCYRTAGLCSLCSFI